MHYAAVINSNRIEIIREVIIAVIESMMLAKSPEEAQKCIEECQLKKKKQQKL